jgi:hypothetical protein
MQRKAIYGLIKEKFTTDWMVQGLNPSGDKTFCTHPDRAWGPPSLLYNKYQINTPPTTSSHQFQLFHDSSKQYGYINHYSIELTAFSAEYHYSTTVILI